MRFSDIPGHSDIIDKLKRAVDEGRVSHAQLFTGPEGCGSLALALAYAQYVSCNNRKEGDSCDTCKSCEKYKKYIHPDLHFSFPVVNNRKNVDPLSINFMTEWREFLLKSPYFTLNDWLDYIKAGNSQAVITVGEANEIIRQLSLKSFESDYKVMIIWLPEKMNVQASNSLLKLLEEPPEKTLFLLVSDDPDKLLPTILSRCQMVKIPAFTDAEMSSFLETRYNVPTDKASDLAHVANGNICKAIELASASDDTDKSFLEWFISMMRNAYLFRIKNDAIKLVTWAEELSSVGRETQKGFLIYAMGMIRENLMLSLGDVSGRLVHMSDDEADFSKKFHQFINERNVFYFSNELNLAYSHIEANGNAKLVFLDLGLKIARHICD